MKKKYSNNLLYFSIFCDLQDKLKPDYEKRRRMVRICKEQERSTSNDKVKMF